MDHIGVLSLDRERTVEFLSMLPDVGEWKFFDRLYKKEDLLIGAGYAPRIANAVIKKQTYYFEVVQPVLDQCDKESYCVFSRENPCSLRSTEPKDLLL
ncbi:hypothetical protein FACS1894204_10420 [Synergistales bacterium]|nr:hypothetical protein FACS1894204_10420 [Synergistales bacterium]